MLPNSRWIVSILALMCQTGAVSADVITDWNERTVAFVTPRMVPAAGQMKLRWKSGKATLPS